MSIAIHSISEKFARIVTMWVGSTFASLLAFLVVIIWIIGGFFFGFDTDYQIYVNTVTTIITYIMVFLIQRSQNKDTFALQIKLNELIASTNGASNRLIDVEGLTEDEIAKLYRRYRRLALLSSEESDRTKSHTVEEIDDD